MKLQIRKSSDRGSTSHGWLESKHTFSFAEYDDPQHAGFRSLKVINDDLLAPGRGFNPHPHRDMEIFSYVLAGELEHRDSMGNGRILQPGQVQLMSAGTGVMHSEFNPSDSESTRFLQVWIVPNRRGLVPAYTEWHPKPEHSSHSKVLIISPDGRDQSAVIRQDAEVFRIRLEPGESVTHELIAGRGLWLHVVGGTLQANGIQLHDGDSVSSDSPGQLTIRAVCQAEALLFDLK